jgi:hypothetical protein
VSPGHSAPASFGAYWPGDDAQGGRVQVHSLARQRCGAPAELFADFVNLAEDDSAKRRTLYITGNLPERFLQTSNRQLASVCERRPEILERLHHAHGDRYRTVREYYSGRGNRVEIVDLTTLLPAYQLDA